MVSKDAILGVLKKCDIALDGNVISKELVLQSFGAFLAETSYKNKHNNGFVLHTGSICFDAIIVVHSILTCLMEDHVDPVEILKSLKKDDLVFYTRNFGKKPSKCQYKCFIDINGERTTTYGENVKYVLLAGNKTAEYKIPQEHWNLIRPDYGKSKRLDGRGVRSIFPLREKFFTQVLNMEKKDIPSEVKNTVVLVMDRERAHSIIRGLTFIADGQIYSALDLLTFSYYTEEEEYRFGSNIAKSEANIKITGKISAARRQILNTNGNKHIGLVISGNDIIDKNITEIPELLKRRSITYVHLLSNIDSENALNLLQEIEAPEIFACSKKFLEKNAGAIVEQNPLTQALYRQIEQIQNHQINEHKIKGFLSWEDYKIFKDNLFFIKKNCPDSNEKENFIVNAYSLMKLFLTAVFNLNMFETCIDQALIKVCRIEERILTLKQSIQDFSQEIHKKADEVITVLEILQESLQKESEKEKAIREFMKVNHNKKIAIVVPKAFYITILRESRYDEIMDSPDLLTIINANKFNNKEVYDYIIVAGVFSGTRFSIFNCMASENIEVFLYDFEEILFKHFYRKAKKKEEGINKINSDITLLPENYQNDNSKDIEADIEDAERKDSEIEDYIDNIEEKSIIKNMGTNKNETMQSEVVAVGIFDNGERIFFSKYYRAYILDKESGTTNEVNVTELAAGDSIVFTKNDAQTHDIVDSVLKNLLSEKKLGNDIENAYQLSVRWKEKFFSYVERQNLPPNKIAEQMVRDGIPVQEATIRRWLDPYAHLVGPRKKESLEHIALKIGDDELFDNVDKYFKSIQIIRKKRVEILTAIGDTIIDRLNGLSKPRNKMMEDFFDKIDSLTQILTLEQIKYANRMVPINLINRPLNIGN